jgi:hypothetical protein
MGRIFVFACLLLAAGITAPSSQEVPPSDAPQSVPRTEPDQKEENPAALRLLRHFSDFCLQEFPDDAALAAAVEAAGGVAMTADELKARLHDDPGQGWMLDSPEGRFAIVLEYPPYHACAARVTAEKALASKLYAALMAVHAAQDKHVLSKPTLIPARFQDGMSLMAAHQILNAYGSPISPKENFMIVFDIQNDPKLGVETRLVYQIVP